MHDNTLVAWALIISALGIAGLLFALIILEVPLTTIANATMAGDGAVVRVTGTVQRVQERGGMTIATISQPATIDVILDSNATALSAGDCITVQGKKGSFNSQAQISASRIIKCKTK
jgi:DNA/RNA endonuclease YhcR with UshA esterase domain